LMSWSLNKEQKAGMEIPQLFALMRIASLSLIASRSLSHIYSEVLS
jgi:hypothetical protein